MNVLYIALNTIKRHYRDKKAVFRSILMPLLMIVLLGTALNSAYERKNIDKFNVCYFNQDSDAASKEFDKFLSNKDIKDILNVERVSSIEEGKKLVNENKAVSLVVLPKDYSDKLKNGEKAVIEIYDSNDKDIKCSIVENIVDSYNSAGNAVMAAAKLNSRNLSFTKTNSLDEQVISIKGKAPRIIDYYGVAMLILSIMSSATFSANMASEDYFDDIAVRIKAAPAKAYEKLIGKVLGCVFDVCIKGIIIIAFSKFIYGVNWGNNWGMIALIIVSAGVYSTLLGMFMVMAFGSSNKAAGVLSIINNVFTFLAGGYVIMTQSDVYSSLVMHLSPNFYPQTALFNVIYSNNYKVTIQFFSTFGYISVLWLLAGLLGFGFIVLERRRVR